MERDTSAREFVNVWLVFKFFAWVLFLDFFHVFFISGTGRFITSFTYGF